MKCFALLIFFLFHLSVRATYSEPNEEIRQLKTQVRSLSSEISDIKVEMSQIKHRMKTTTVTWLPCEANGHHSLLSSIKWDQVEDSHTFYCPSHCSKGTNQPPVYGGCKPEAVYQRSSNLCQAARHAGVRAGKAFQLIVSLGKRFTGCTNHSVTSIQANTPKNDNAFLIRESEQNIVVFDNQMPGPAGPKGDRGLPGSNGQHGVPGSIGPPGQNGRDGRDGKPGSPGVNGARGAKGDTGLAGPKGPRALAGFKGEGGPSGHPGLPGIPGEKGQMGDRGLKGELGQRGLKGNEGNCCTPDIATERRKVVIREPCPRRVQIGNAIDVCCWDSLDSMTRPKVGSTYEIRCPDHPCGKFAIRGCHPDAYTHGSPFCGAAEHAGLAPGATFTLQVVDQRSYRSCSRNRVWSESHDSTGHHGYKIAQVLNAGMKEGAVYFAPPIDRKTIHDINSCGYDGYDDKPHMINWGLIGSSYLFRCKHKCSISVVSGCNPYLYKSEICPSAQHSGIEVDQPFKLTVTQTGEYSGCGTKNGVESRAERWSGPLAGFYLDPVIG